MKFNKQIFRKVLWAPTAFASVSLTLYLSNLWLSQNNSRMLNSTPPEQQDEKQKDESSPANASPDGKDEETTEAKKQTPPPTPPAPTPKDVTPTSTHTPTAKSDEKQESSNNSSPATDGNKKPEEYIVIKIREINENGTRWSASYNNELLSSWKITKSVETLLGAIEQFLKENPPKEN